MNATNTPSWLLLAIVVVGLIVIVAIWQLGSNKRAHDRNVASAKTQELANEAQRLNNEAVSDQLAVLAELAGKSIENRRPIKELGYVDVVTVDPEPEPNGHHTAQPATHSAN